MDDKTNKELVETIHKLENENDKLYLTNQYLKQKIRVIERAFETVQNALEIIKSIWIK